MRFAKPLFFAVISLICAQFAPGQNLILNGDFEAEPHDPFGAITNWTISGTGFVHCAMQGSSTGNFSAALSIGSDSEGDVLSQSLPTVTGQAYTVEFDSGIFGTRTGDRLRLNVQVLGSGTVLARTITPPDAFTALPGDVVFQHYRFTFIADNTTTTLQFTDIGLGNANADTLVDSASVVPVTLPTPTTLPLVNGDFETGPYNVNGTVSGWTVYGAGRVSILLEGATSGSVSAAFSSGGDFQDDVLSQRFFTIAGQHYAVDFDAAVYGITDSTQRLRVRVMGNNSVLDQILTPPYFGTFDTSQINFQHYHFFFTADIAVATLEFTDIGTGNTDADLIVDSVSVAPFTPPSFSQWQADHFDANQLSDPQISGWNADPDHDRIANGLEFFFNTNPLAGITFSDANSLPRVAIEVSSSSPYLTYTFRRLLNWTGNAAVVGVSDDLIIWDESGNQIEPVSVIPSGDGLTEIVKVRLKTPINQGSIRRKFLRLSLTQ